MILLERCTQNDKRDAFKIASIHRWSSQILRHSIRITRAIHWLVEPSTIAAGFYQSRRMHQMDFSILIMIRLKKVFYLDLYPACWGKGWCHQCILLCWNLQKRLFHRMNKTPFLWDRKDYTWPIYQCDVYIHKQEPEKLYVLYNDCLFSYKRKSMNSCGFSLFPSNSQPSWLSFLTILLF